jgi:hypothetical protein
MHLIPSRHQRNVAFPIPLEREAIPVVAVAICFDDYALSRPEEIDEIALGEDIDLRGRQPRFTT